MIEQSLKEQGLSVKRSDSEDIKRLMAVYYVQNAATERFEDFDGGRLDHPGELTAVHKMLITILKNCGIL